jgi:hypothetical protein
MLKVFCKGVEAEVSHEIIGVNGIVRAVPTGNVVWTHDFINIENGHQYRIQDDHRLCDPGDKLELEITVTTKG